MSLILRTAFSTMDQLFCSDELLYFTAHLFLYRPHINDPIRDSFEAGKQVIFPNFQNVQGKRYDMYADVVSQIAYNYWDRIGDLIASFILDRIDKERVYFVTAVNSIPSEFHTSPNFIWLKHFSLL
ncbi:MAG: hypothetical protein HW412_2275 [Bacteroidetes bacterium]|nr:hypothetical protein [Bacteroidota bacterium]